ncbi:PAS domain-containing protein [Streptomyces sp. NPDC093970]|uniref:SpoIIE family protein phosphatase n=1 Tax=Streptomyces sp. NPDC093970 TaxID=3155076 RepID=UPI003424E069
MSATDETPRQSLESGTTTADVVVDQFGVIAKWSAAAERCLGFTASEVEGRAACDLLAARQAARPDEPDRACRGREAPVALRCRDGSTAAFQVRICPAADHPGGWNVALTPMTEISTARAVDDAVLDALFNRSPTSLCVYDPELRLRRFNPAARGMQGVFDEDSVGRTPDEIWPDSNADAFEIDMRRVLETGVPRIEFEKRGRPPEDREHEHVFRTSIFRLEDPSGDVLGLATTAVEITEQRRAEQHIALLAQASSVIGTSLDVMETGQQLADVSVPGLADAIAVDLFAPVLAGEDPAPTSPASPPPVLTSGDLLRVGMRFACDRFDLAGSGRPGLPYPSSVASLVRTPEPRHEVTELPADDGEPLYRGTGGRRSAYSLVMPVTARGTVLGFVSFYKFGLTDPFTEFDVMTCGELVSRAALCIDNARQYTREHDTARGMQRDFAPQGVVDHAAVETAHYFAPTSSEANWFDVIPLSGARVALVLATTDEAGLRGAATVGRLGAAVHTLTHLDLSPEEVLARLDGVVKSISGFQAPDPDDHRGGAAAMDLRCVYAVYDPATGGLVMSSAGHRLPVVARPDGELYVPPAAVGPPLGTSDMRAKAEELGLEAGSTLVFSSSFSDAASPADVQERLMRTLSAAATAPLRELKEKVLDSTRAASASSASASSPSSSSSPPGSAGEVLLLARTQRLSDDNVSTWEFPADPAVVATARSLVEHQLCVWGLDAAAFTTELVVSELVTNAIRYGRGPFGLRMIRDRQVLICEVSDGSATAPHLRYARSSDEGGRGLFLIAELTDRWGTRFGTDGKTIWAEQDLAAA